MTSLVRYGFVGLMSTFTHVFIGWLLVDVMNWQAAVGNSIAFCASACVAYLGNSRWTFSGHDQKEISAVSKYIVTALVGFIYNYICVFALVIQGGFPYLHVLVFIIISWPFLSFLILRSWVFSK